jgi:hypothetical protein
MTFNEMISEVQGNLGNRVSGSIGGQTTSTVVMRAINRGLMQCVKLSNPSYYERELVVNLAAGSTTKIAYPTIGGLRIKDIVTAKLTRASDDTTVNIVRTIFKEFIRINSSYFEDTVGIPSSWAVYADYIYLNRVPQEAYNLNLYCEVWPTTLVFGDLNLAMPIGVEWELAVEAFATSQCFAKLQQLESSEYWEKIYESQKATNTRVKRKTDAHGADGQGGYVGDDCVFDPFCHSNRIGG